MKYESATVAHLWDNVIESIKGIDADLFRTTYVCDMYRVSARDMDVLEDMFDEDELTLMLVSYVVLKMAKGKKAYLSKFVKKMSK